MLVIFNAIQFVLLLISLPSIIAWLGTNPIQYAVALKIVAFLALCGMTVYTIVAVAESFEGKK